MSAAVNARVTNTDFEIFGAEVCSPKMHKAPKINNYLGFYNTTGEEIRKASLDHIETMGVKLSQSKIDTIYPQQDYYTLLSGNEGEEQYLGRGVSYYATCDGPLFKGRTVAVIAFTDTTSPKLNFIQLGSSHLNLIS